MLEIEKSGVERMKHSAMKGPPHACLSRPSSALGRWPSGTIRQGGIYSLLHRGGPTHFPLHSTSPSSGAASASPRGLPYRATPETRIEIQMYLDE